MERMELVAPEALNRLEEMVEVSWELVGSPTLQIQVEQVEEDNMEEVQQIHHGVQEAGDLVILVECLKVIQPQV